MKVVWKITEFKKVMHTRLREGLTRPPFQTSVEQHEKFNDAATLCIEQFWTSDAIMRNDWGGQVPCSFHADLLNYAAGTAQVHPGYCVARMRDIRGWHADNVGGRQIRVSYIRIFTDETSHWQSGISSSRFDEKPIRHICIEMWNSTSNAPLHLTRHARNIDTCRTSIGYSADSYHESVFHALHTTAKYTNALGWQTCRELFTLHSIWATLDICASRQPLYGPIIRDA